MPPSPPNHSKLDDLRADLPASLVVFLVALPLCLGIALASGAPMLSGLIAGIVGGIVVGALSGSALGVSGPAAGLAVVVLTAIEDLGSFELFLCAVVVAGVLQALLGLLRAGFIAYFFPSSVIHGMLAGIGIIIFLKQIPHAFGWDHDPIGELSYVQPDGETTFSEIEHILSHITPGATIVAAVALAILLLWGTRPIQRRPLLALIPAPVLAVLSGVLLNLLFARFPDLALAPEHLVQIPISSGWMAARDLVTAPDLAGLTNPKTYAVAATIAIVASIETLLCVEATDKLDAERRMTPTNRELVAQGIGNTVSGLLGGLPVTQVIVRSSANIQSGARSKASAIFHGVWLLAAVLLFPHWMNLIPLATLAAILLVVGFKLAPPALFRRMAALGPFQLVPFLITIGGIVFTDLLTGVGYGLAVALLTILYENYRLPFQISQVHRTGGDHVQIVLAQQVTFLNKATVLRTLHAIPPGTEVEIDATRSIFIHPDVLEVIEDFQIHARTCDITVHVRGLDEAKLRPKVASLSVQVASPSTADEAP